MLQKPPFLFISDDNEHNNLRYTSLKDVISSSDGFGSFFSHSVPSQDGILLSEMDSSNIAIRNELVKRAASMYLQSSMIVSAPDTNWFQRFCLKAKHAVDCLRPVYRIFSRSS
ncbi:Uncharacterized protein Rs2_38092 [Raphanus sativus]|uniref:Uncharacterized protein LOC108821602 n=1 Tax=Raphanus sativus TaxID=3726 RepID=A0A6J0KQ77_RAPSA|nr:uncharacterized protein LOC108821602 [Raphanus sativus]KAJ4881037.1 Uncharacterized protein Rs2_38092 [Raphanus sativus]